MPDKTISLVKRIERKDKTARREQFLDRYIAMLRHGIFSPMRHDQAVGLMNSSFEVKDAYVRTHQRRVVSGVAAVALLWLSFSVYRYFVPAQIPPAPQKPTLEAAGVVQDIQLHSTTFATETTVKTSTGVYQVHGGVSAANGDAATIKREEYQRVSLCIESKIKNACYTLL
jgi:hypothetical protein